MKEGVDVVLTSGPPSGGAHNYVMHFAFAVVPWLAVGSCPEEFPTDAASGVAIATVRALSVVEAMAEGSEDQQ